ncbi:carotenoid cleavage dioxygenase 1 [Xylaria nigripes]|nr:carotenoid cleavage dioxygenase 1 [Xylaria nigripes]
MDSTNVGGHEPLGLIMEDHEFESVVRNRLDRNFEDWPNECGFEGLTEVRGPVDLAVVGSIPGWAAGSLYRTGPGGFTVRNSARNTFYRATHWFDGFAHTHKFKIISEPSINEPVRVEYSSRYQAEEYVDTIRKAGRLPGLSFGQRQDPCIGIFGKLMTVFRREDLDNRTSANICVTVHADVPGFTSEGDLGHRKGPRNVYLGTDTSLMQQIDPETLEPIGLARQSSLHPLLRGPLSSAHAQRDPKTGDVFNFNLEMGYHSTYRVFRTSMSDGKTDILATISGPDIKPAYIHSFFLSPSYVILCIPSSHLGYMGISVPWNGNIVDAIEPFSESKLSKWFVVDRHGGQGVVATFETSAGFFFHSINTFEERDDSTGDINVFCDTIEYPSTEVIRAYELDVLVHNEEPNDVYMKDEQRVRNCLPRLVRRKFQIATESPDDKTPIEPAKIIEIKAPYAGELPTINPAYATKKHRYVYSLATHGYSTLHDTIVKTDLDTRKTISWQGPAGHTPGEAIFVPRPQALRTGENSDSDEDDGVLLSVILDGYGRSSYLLCLNARDMKEVGRALCEWPIGHGFHGLHV